MLVKITYIINICLINPINTINEWIVCVKTHFENIRILFDNKIIYKSLYKKYNNFCRIQFDSQNNQIENYIIGGIYIC